MRIETQQEDAQLLAAGGLLTPTMSPMQLFNWASVLKTDPIFEDEGVERERDALEILAEMSAEEKDALGKRVMACEIRRTSPFQFLCIESNP